MQPPHTLVFDLDDTLFAESDFVLSGFEAAGEWLVQNHQVDGFTNAAVELFKTGVRGTIFDEALRRLARTDGAVLVPELVKIYRRHIPKIQLLPEARECLDWAKGRFNLALVTDGYAEVQRRKIEALGVGSCFDCIVVTDEIGREFWKPHPEGFRRVESVIGDSRLVTSGDESVIRDLRLVTGGAEPALDSGVVVRREKPASNKSGSATPPQSLITNHQPLRSHHQSRLPSAGYVYIADNPRKDFIGPRSLGWRTIRVRRPGGEHSEYEAAEHERADVEVGTLAELAPVIGDR